MLISVTYVHHLGMNFLPFYAGLTQGCFFVFFHHRNFMPGNSKRQLFGSRPVRPVESGCGLGRLRRVGSDWAGLRCFNLLRK